VAEKCGNFGNHRQVPQISSHTPIYPPRAARKWNQDILSKYGSRIAKEKEQEQYPQEETEAKEQEEDSCEPHYCRELVFYLPYLLPLQLISDFILYRNQKETLSQNYRRLGLTARLNHATGGTEKTIKLLGLDKDGLNDGKSARADAPEGSTANKLNIVSQAPEATTTEEVEVERDPETGKIIRVISDPSQSRLNPLNDPLNDIVDLDEDDGVEEWNGFAMVPEGTESENPVIRQLEEAARNGVRKAPRVQSTREEEWIQRLWEKYGDDYAKMFRDRKLNPMQQSEGDLKRRVKKWKNKYGVE
jgi:nucleolar protein 16